MSLLKRYSKQRAYFNVFSLHASLCKLLRMQPFCQYQMCAYKTFMATSAAASGSITIRNKVVSALSRQCAQLLHSSGFHFLLLQGIADLTLTVGLHSVRTAMTISKQGGDIEGKNWQGKFYPRQIGVKLLAQRSWLPRSGSNGRAKAVPASV